MTSDIYHLINLYDIQKMIEKYRDKTSGDALRQARRRAKQTGNLQRWISLGITNDFLKVEEDKAVAKRDTLGGEE